MKTVSNSVTKHNTLIDASYRLSLHEIRIILYGLSLINPLSDEFPLSYEIEIKKFAKMFSLQKNKHIYQQLKDTVMTKFWEREFTINSDNGERIRHRWLISIKYSDNKGYLQIFMNPMIKEFLHQLKGNFTSYHLDHISSFKSTYSIRLYELLIMHVNRSGKDKSVLSIDVDDIKHLFGVPDKYKKFANFKKYVIDLALSEINRNSDIFIDYQLIRKGRKPFTILFNISKKNAKPTINKYKHIISPSILEKAKWLANDAQLDILELQKQFCEYSNKKGMPKNIDNAFLGFVKRKING